MPEIMIYTNKIVCPYCGYVDESPFENWEILPTNPWVSYYCESCDGEFDVYTEVELTIHVKRWSE